MMRQRWTRRDNPGHGVPDPDDSSPQDAEHACAGRDGAEPLLASRADRGSVTAEFAVVLPALTALLALLLLGAGAGLLQLRLEEGARAGARALARGESTAKSADIARNLSGGGSAVSVDLTAGYATVTVTGGMSGPLAVMMPWQQSAKATARMENFGLDQAVGGRERPGPVLPRLPVRRLTGWILAFPDLVQPEVAAGDGEQSPRKTALWRWARAPAGSALELVQTGKYSIRGAPDVMQARTCSIRGAPVAGTRPDGNYHGRT